MAPTQGKASWDGDDLRDPAKPPVGDTRVRRPAPAGGGVRPGFEGGQMPIYRRVASRGFSNHRFKKEYVVINISSLERVFSDGDTVCLETLVQKGLVKKSEKLVKILGFGELKKKLDVTVPAVSVSAKEKIEKTGGNLVISGTEAPGK